MSEEIEIGLYQLQNGDIECLVIQGDCLSILSQLPENLVHLTVTDPPYESIERHRAVGTTTRLKKSKASSNPWFKSFPNASFYELFAELYRVHRKDTHCYTFCDSETEHVLLSGHNPYSKELDGSLQAFKLVNSKPVAPTSGWRAWPTLSWVKTKRSICTADLQREDQWLRDASDVGRNITCIGNGWHWRRSDERIAFLEKGKRKLNDNSLGSVLHGPRAGRDDYPAQKPQSVLQPLVRNSSDFGQIVLDPFAGSGSTGVAAAELGRRSILIDIDIGWMREHPPAKEIYFVQE